MGRVRTGCQDHHNPGRRHRSTHGAYLDGHHNPGADFEAPSGHILMSQLTQCPHTTQTSHNTYTMTFYSSHAKTVGPTRARGVPKGLAGRQNGASRTETRSELGRGVIPRIIQVPRTLVPTINGLELYHKVKEAENKKTGEVRVGKRRTVASFPALRRRATGLVPAIPVYDKI